MALSKLTDAKIESILSKALKAAKENEGKSALIGDGGGLYLSVAKTGSASWLFRYMVLGKAHAVGLGGYPKVSLKIARIKAQELRDSLAHGIDPAFAKHEKVRQQKIERSKAKTFEECAAQYIELQRPQWRNPKHAQQWSNTVATYAAPIIGKTPISLVETGDILQILSPIWTEKPETASRLRGRLESILGWAAIHGWRTGSNPARLKDHLEHLLPKRVGAAHTHHPSMPYGELPVFVSRLQSVDGMSRYALEFLILCASRTGEVLGATLAEVDFSKRIWTIPASRMKAKIEHRVPLTDRAIEILNTVQPFSHGKFIFSSDKSGKPLSNMSMAMLLRRMGIEDYTVHGMRSSFRNWCGECTDVPFNVAEHALAHRLPDAVQAAYLRTDFFEKRVSLMNQWSAFVGSATNNELPK
jgi:integrase